MKIQIRANYQNEGKIGAIRVSKIVGKKPIEYILQLFENSNIVLNKNKYASVSSAIAGASQYGFLTNLWAIEELEV
jgi:hypothetical protein